jgi:predicted nucleotidyltransferase
MGSNPINLTLPQQRLANYRVLSMNRNEVCQALAAHSTELRERFGVKSLALFGSVARDESTAVSDVDLLVEFDRRIGLFHLIDTENFIRGLLGIEKVDLVMRRAVLPELKEEVFAEAIDVL